MDKTAVLVDLSWMLYRYHFAFTNFSVQIDGERINTGVYYGIGQFIESVLKGNPSTKIVFCKDGHPKDRHDLDDSYKANRAMDEDKKMQAVEVHGYTDTLGEIFSIVPDVSFAYEEDKEADDLMASISFDLMERDHKVVVFSGDDDMLQLMSYGVRIARKVKVGIFEFLTSSYIQEKYQVEPNQLLFFRALCGDSSDNISPVVPRLNRDFARAFVAEWAKVGFEKAFSKFDQTHSKYTSKIHSALPKLKKNLELMSLVKYKSPKYRIITETFKYDPKPHLITDYQLSSFKRFLTSAYPGLL